MNDVLGMVKDHVTKWNPKLGGEGVDEILFNEKWFFPPLCIDHQVETFSFSFHWTNILLKDYEIIKTITFIVYLANIIWTKSFEKN